MSSSLPPLVVIAGPTASGKSALALALAQQIRGVIVNADSAQVYKDLPILSASPTIEQLHRAEHRLYGTQDGASPFSANDWALRAKQEILEVHAQGRVPILVGGTGLYIRTLLDGLAPIPPIDPEVRTAVRAESVDVNRSKLAQLDPEAASRLRPTDKARINRALEVILSTGRHLADFQQEQTGGLNGSIALRPLVLQPPRDWLYARCNERFAHMVENGAFREIEALLARKLDPELPVMRAIGVRELARHLDGEQTLEEAVLAGQQATRRYAKRQYTWFAHQPPPTWPRFSDALNDGNLMHALALVGREA